MAMPSEGSDVSSGPKMSESRNVGPKSCNSCNSPPTCMSLFNSTSSSASPRYSLNDHSRIGSPRTNGGTVDVVVLPGSVVDGRVVDGRVVDGAGGSDVAGPGVDVTGGAGVIVVPAGRT